MPRKKQVKKTQKSKKLGIDPTLKPIVIETKGGTKEQQEDNPLNRSFVEKKNLPDGFKTADTVTEVDDLKFENGRLREMLSAFLDKITVDGKMYNVLVDPLNRVIEITRNNAI